MYLIDFMWGILAIAGASVPVYRLYDNRHRPGALALLALVLVCASYGVLATCYAKLGQSSSGGTTIFHACQQHLHHVRQLGFMSHPNI